MVENKKLGTGQNEFAAAQSNTLLGGQKLQQPLGPQQVQQGNLTFVKVGEQVYDETIQGAPLQQYQQQQFVSSTAATSIPIQHHEHHKHHKPILGQQQFQQIPQPLQKQQFQQFQPLQQQQQFQKLPLQQEFGMNLHTKRPTLLPYGWQEPHVVSFPKPQFLFRSGTKWRRPAMPMQDQLSIHELKYQCQQELVNKWKFWSDRSQEACFAKKQWKPIMDKCIREASLVGQRVGDIKFNRAGLPIHDSKLERFHDNIIKEAAMVGKVLQQKWQRQGSLSLEKKIDMIVSAAKSKQLGSKLSKQIGLKQQQSGAQWKQHWGRQTPTMSYSASYL